MSYAVSILDKSKDFKLFQLLNIPPILLTFEVIKLDKFNCVKFEQLANIQFILVTNEVSNLDTSKEIKDLHS